MKLTKMSVLLAVAASALASTAAVADMAYEDVPFDDYGAVEASLTGAAGNAENGAAIFGDKKSGNCVACHLISSNPAPYPGSVGPSLDGVGDRWTEAEIRGIVTDAKRTFDGSVMPSFYKTSGYIRPGDAFTGKAGTEPLPPLLTAAQIEDLVAYLVSIKE